ncbi:dihydroorotase family protein [Streptomyces sp. 549]|uniref:dihydroorotase n=1 Tax=Streptomyces sp. 549 TaxID=3049076 RepID=UPI0024C39044|nr:dihydroorotase family protein [Streptomyces sp. 549]MDK1475902.1 dihydroorotase family protein [Streptomyces sp. 549]
MEPLNTALSSRTSPASGHTGEADLVVEGGRLVTPEGVREGAAVVRDGRITALLAPGDRLPSGPRLDARGRYVLPGLIDSHVHFRTPGLEHKETWEHGSRAALAGGVTTVMDMPNTRPPSLDAASLQAKAALIAGRSYVDHHFHLGADPDHPEVLADLDPAVATSAKAFMAGHHTAPVVFREAHELEAAFAAAARGNVRLVLHAEDQHVFDLLDSRSGDPESYDAYEPHRPRSGAIVAVAKVIHLARTHGTKVHVLHVSSAEETDMLAAAAAEGLPISFEVTGHHLSFTDDDTVRRGPRTRLSPAIRAARDRERLWQAVLSGEATTVGSDHAPHTVEEKNRPPAEAPPGLPGVQELAVSIWTGLLARGVEADTAAAHLARLMGEGPSELFRLPGKGRLAVGADADLALLDPAARWQLSAEHVQSLCGWSAYEGWTFTGRFTTVVTGGRVAWDLAHGTVGEPRGRWLRGPARRLPEPTLPTVPHRELEGASR